MKKLLFFIGVLLFTLCLPYCSHRGTDYPPTLSIINDDIDVLIGVIISRRKNSDSVSDFYFRDGSNAFRLPCSNTFNKSMMLNPKYDVNEYLNYIGYDSQNREKFISEYCAKVYEIYYASKAFTVFSDLKLGEFVVFQYSNEPEFFYVKNNGLIKDSSWAKHIDESTLISRNWYKGNNSCLPPLKE